MPLNRHQEEGHHTQFPPQKKQSAFGKCKKSPPLYADIAGFEWEPKGDDRVGYGAGVFLTPRTGEIVSTPRTKEANVPIVTTPRTPPIIAPRPEIPSVDLLIAERLRRIDESRGAPVSRRDDCSARGAMAERSTEPPQYGSLASMGRKGREGLAMTDRSTEASRSTRSLPSTARTPLSPESSRGLTERTLASHQAVYASPQSSDFPVSYRSDPAAGGQWAAMSDIASVDWSTVARDLDIPLDFGPSEEIYNSYRPVPREEAIHNAWGEYSARELASIDDNALRSWAKDNVIEGGALPAARHPPQPANDEDVGAQYGAGAVIAGIALFFAL